MNHIPLRDYLLEIDQLIDDRSFQAAIDACRRVMITYPKNLAVYRLLGQALLYDQAYQEAIDIFLRLLSSIPDDFTAHLGLGLLREQEGKLDAAIWHIERAWEVKPASQAVQVEVARLQRRKGGSDQPLQLSRVALGRLYLQGGCFEQGIAELLAATREEPQRNDIQVLLAEAYAQAGLRQEALATSQAVLLKLPFCQAALRILFQAVLQEGDLRAGEPYQRRLQELDPYWAFVTPAEPDPSQAPDAAVIID
jgi:predicted Zn-dependent protease